MASEPPSEQRQQHGGGSGGSGSGHVGVPRWQQALLPGAMRAAPDGRRSPRDWFVDVLMFVLALTIGGLILGEAWDDHHSTATAVADLVLGVGASVSLWWRRRHPFAIAAGTGVLALVFAAPAGAALLAYFNAVLRVRLVALVPLTLLGVAAAITIPYLYPSQDATSTEITIGLLISVIVLGWGLFVRVQRELVRSLHERTARAESEQRLRVEQAQAAERRRIAREMHDVLAHRVSLLSLHAGALEFRPDAPPAEIAEAAGVVRASARAALEDLRAVIGVLREDGAGEEGDGAPEPPQPTLAQIPALVEQSRAAGMRIGCHIDLAGLGEATVGAALGRTAYRIVQEGLTNAHKHAPAAAVEVEIRALCPGDGEDGRGGRALAARRSGRAAAAGPRLLVEVISRPAVGKAAVAPDETLPGAGTGLVGLRERVVLAAGELVHGPDEHGDFVLRAILPVMGAGR
jgi:signal transduction histidine kinase